MTDRLTSMRRLKRVQDQVKRIAEADLRTAESRKARIEEAALGLDALIGDADRSPRLVKIAMGQRRLVAVRQTEADAAIAAQAEVTREARSRFRLAERMVDDLKTEEARIQERKDLERLIEGMVGREPDPWL